MMKNQFQEIRNSHVDFTPGEHDAGDVESEALRRRLAQLHNESISVTGRLSERTQKGSRERRKKRLARLHSGSMSVTNRPSTTRRVVFAQQELFSGVEDDIAYHCFPAARIFSACSREEKVGR